MTRRRACPAAWLLLILATIVGGGGATAGEIFDDPVLRDKIGAQLALDLRDVPAGEPVTCLVIFDSPPSLAAAGGIPVPQLIDRYRRLSFSIQDQVLEAMAAEDPGAIEVIQRYWLLNCAQVRGKPKDVKKLGRKKRVRKLARGGRVRLIDPGTGAAAWPAGGDPLWNLERVGAVEAWDRGYDGQGVIVGHLDTGVAADHPALAGKFAGRWFDAVAGLEQPYDDHGHGTHTLGTLLGGDGPGPWPADTGVAPGATWVAAKVLDASGGGSILQCLAGLQWMAETKAEVDIDVVCGSWTLEESVDGELLAEVSRILLELDILPVFAVGNDGPAAGSVDVPGSYPTVLGVGAVDAADLPADFSSRGPAPAAYLEEWDILPVDPEWLGHKPDLAAPGVDVLSCAPGGGYVAMSGTSMAAPHVAGAAALLLDRDDDLSPRMLAIALLGGCEALPDQGTPPGNACGWGLLDIPAALDLVVLPGGPPETIAAAPPAGPRLDVAAAGGSATIAYRLQTARSARLEIFDLAGRRLRTLDVPLGATAGDLIWNGRDDAGRPVRSGVYFVRLQDGAAAAVARCVLVR